MGCQSYQVEYTRKEFNIIPAFKIKFNRYLGSSRAAYCAPLCKYKHIGSRPLSLSHLQSITYRGDPLARRAFPHSALGTLGKVSVTSAYDQRF